MQVENNNKSLFYSLSAIFALLAIGELPNAPAINQALI